MEKGLLNFIDFLDDVVCSISAEDFRVKYINRAAEEVLGYTPEDFLDDAQLFVKIIHPEDREFVLKTFENLLNDKKFDIEFRVISPGKKIIWIRARGKLSYVPSDSSPYIFCVLRDISRRMMEQKELSYQLAFQKLVSHISKEFVNFSPINFDEKVLYALQRLCEFAEVERCYLFKFSWENEVLESIYEWRREERKSVVVKDINCSFKEYQWLISKLNDAEFLDIDDVFHFPSEASRGKSFIEAQGIRSLLIFPIHYRGSLLGFLGFGSQEKGRTWNPKEIELLKVISEIISIALNRLQMMMELKASEERYRLFVENFQGIAYKRDVDFKPVFLYGQIEQITGYKKEEFLSQKRWMEIIHPEDLPIVKEYYEGLKNKPGSTADFEYRILDRRGGIRWVRELSRSIDSDPRYVEGVIFDISNLKELQRELFEEKEMFKVTLQSIGEGIIVVDTAGRVQLMNEAAERITGWNRREAYGRDVEEVFNIINEKTRRKVDNPVKRVLATGAVLGLANHTILIRRDGTELNIDDSCSPIRNENGEMVGGVLIFRDITEKRKAQREIERSKERLNIMFEVSPIPIGVFSVEGYVEMWNGAAEKTYGWKKEEILGKFNPTVPEDRGDEFLKILKKVAAGETLKGIEVLRKRKDGSLLWIMASYAPIFDDVGRVVGILFIGEDITYRKKMEEALRESEKKFRLLAENAQDLIFRLILDPCRKYEYVSPSAEKITGYSPEEFYKDPDIDLKLVHPEDRDIYDGKNFEKIMELRWKRKDGRTIWVEKHNTLIYDEEGRLVAVEGIVRDITKRKELEQELEYQSTHDSLTGLYNRAFFEKEMNRLQDKKLNSLGIVVIDVDGLKIINDSMGHTVGDELLKAAADILKAAFRKGDVVARVGGDEFAVLLPNVEEEDLKKISSRVESLIEEYNKKHSGLPLSMTLGYSVAHGESINVDELFKKADNNMYKKKLFRSRSTRSAAVNALLKIMETRDFYSEGHGERILELVAAMARKLNLSEAQTADLMLFAQFHDIGKVGIPDRILFKKGKLTPEECEEMKRHSEIGYRIALSSPDLAPIADFILKHHEWWNGEGYPLRLKGEDIPLECRILAIADAYDAMTNDRPYRNGKTHEEALAELKRLAGKQFDPQLVDVFIEVVEEMKNKKSS